MHSEQENNTFIPEKKKQPCKDKDVNVQQLKEYFSKENEN